MGGSFLKDIRVVFFGGVFRFWWGVFGLQLSGSTDSELHSKSDRK